jgi:predicted ATPase
VLSYLVIDDVEAYPSLLSDIEAHRYYSKVFILPPWKEIFTKDDERMEDFESTFAAFETIKATYEKFGYAVIELPKVSIEERVDFILSHLKADGIV